ncbi:IVa2 [White sturgeon adenovirus 1]|uniref:IVa2 n=1 Tax=White sturgeon adenovirus 1 TaxID=2580388 RepID=A0A4P8PIT7_9ADEN|nr:IVa2 [White sturgeon adenovirus 1]QCQ84149.1 IVa2 [White sturgeon adenovirus 1]
MYQDKELTEFYNNKYVPWQKQICSLNQGILPNAELIPSEFSQLSAMGNTTPNLLSFLQEDRRITNLENRYMKPNGEMQSLNLKKKPFIVAIYGPTRSGKSVLVRNLISGQYLDPQPETVILITPTTNMLSEEEQIAWRAQTTEGNYHVQGDGFQPITTTFKPNFITLSFDEAITPENLNIENPNSVFCQAAANGPVAIILDDCMEKIINHSNFGHFFHTLPSKISSKYPKCTGYYILVVLHNLFPSSGAGNNIQDLKNQVKMHIISCNCQSHQINSFVNKQSLAVNNRIGAIIKLTIAQLADKDYCFITYSPSAPITNLLWGITDSETNGVIPMCIDIQKNFLHMFDYLLNFCKSKIKNVNKYQNKRKRQALTRDSEVLSPVAKTVHREDGHADEETVSEC